MLTNGDICTQAIEWSGARGVGEAPEAVESLRALRVLESLLLSAIPLGQAKLTDVFKSADYTAGENERVYDTSDTPIIITLPDLVTDATTGLQRAPRNGAIVQGADVGQTWVYVASLGSWSELTNLELAANNPLGPLFEEGLTAMLAVRLAGPQFRLAVDQAVIALAEQGRRSLRQQFRQPYTATTDPLLLSWAQRCGGWR